MNPQKSEFLKLAQASGWNQAEIARQLDLTRGGVNGIVKGATVPSKTLVRLFKFVMAAEKPGTVSETLTRYPTRAEERAAAKEPSLDKLLLHLLDLARNDPASFAVVSNVVETFYIASRPGRTDSFALSDAARRRVEGWINQIVEEETDAAKKRFHAGEGRSSLTRPTSTGQLLRAAEASDDDSKKRR